MSRLRVLTFNFHEPSIQELYREDEAHILEKIHALDARFAETAVPGDA